jgi:hypothetical protein
MSDDLSTARRAGHAVAGAQTYEVDPASGAQMLRLRVSGIRKRLKRNATAGTAMGYTNAQPTL